MSSLKRHMRRAMSLDKGRNDSITLTPRELKLVETAYDQGYKDAAQSLTPLLLAQCFKVIKENFGKLRTKETRLHIFSEMVLGNLKSYGKITQQDWEEMYAILEEAGYPDEILIPDMAGGKKG